MRELLFRAYDLNTNEVIADDVEIDKIYLLVDEGDDITENEGTEIVQYTGIEDCQGKRIYEGDILRVRNGATTFESYFVGNVVFEKGQFGYKAVKHEGTEPPFKFPNNYILSIDSEMSEVISNVYENPELLK